MLWVLPPTLLSIINVNICIGQKSVIEDTTNKIGAITYFKTIIDRDIPIRHNSVAEYAITKTGFITDFSISQIGSSKNNSNHINVDIGSDRMSISQIGTIQGSMSKINTTQVCSLEISTPQLS